MISWLETFRRADAVIFDMDGTLIASDYDWKAIRRHLGVEGDSIIEALNGLPAPERESCWERLRSVEAEATRAARLMPGAKALLEALGRRGYRLALVTNNSESNTRYLLEKFSLAFDEVVTRDSGMWKPSGLPLTHVMKRLDTAPGRCVAVGDTAYDLRAGREAGCGLVLLVGPAAAEWAGQADAHFSDLSRLLEAIKKL